MESYETMQLTCPYCGARVLAGPGSAIGEGEAETGYYHRHNAQMVPMQRGTIPVESTGAASMGAASAAEFLAEMDAQRRGREAAAYERGYRQSVIDNHGS